MDFTTLSSLPRLPSASSPALPPAATTRHKAQPQRAARLAAATPDLQPQPQRGARGFRASPAGGQWGTRPPMTCGVTGGSFPRGKYSRLRASDQTSGGHRRGGSRRHRGPCRLRGRDRGGARGAHCHRHGPPPRPGRRGPRRGQRRRHGKRDRDGAPDADRQRRPQGGHRVHRHRTVRRWRADARPVPVPAPSLWPAVAAEQAEAVVVDVAGPVPLVIEGARLRGAGQRRAAPAPVRGPRHPRRRSPRSPGTSPLNQAPRTPS